ncbi:hypothetical protein BX600DRAFT_527290 [Xylariales sp. PMI_506]|nr:hypothetical protein BX600DRAFT_527290 [Xylariales sp. PMI_506]
MYILARMINYHIAHTNTSLEIDQSSSSYRDTHMARWNELEADLAMWTANLPSTFDTYSTAPKFGNLFPSEWMLQPWLDVMLSTLVNGPQYGAVAKMLLALSSPQSHPDNPRSSHHIIPNLATRICGLAITNKNLAATLNSFGPLIFCGRYLVQKSHQNALEAMLTDFGKHTGYPVELHIRQLQELWTAEDSL